MSSKELINYSILSGLAIGLISLILLFFRKPQICDDKQGAANHNKTIILNSLVVALMSGLAVFFVHKTLVGSEIEQMGGSELDQIMTGSAPF